MPRATEPGAGKATVRGSGKGAAKAKAKRGIASVVTSPSPPPSARTTGPPTPSQQQSTLPAARMPSVPMSGQQAASTRPPMPKPVEEHDIIRTNSHRLAQVAVTLTEVKRATAALSKEIFKEMSSGREESEVEDKPAEGEKRGREGAEAGIPAAKRIKTPTGEHSSVTVSQGLSPSLNAALERFNKTEEDVSKLLRDAASDTISIVRRPLYVCPELLKDGEKPYSEYVRQKTDKKDNEEALLVYRHRSRQFREHLVSSLVKRHPEYETRLSRRQWSRAMPFMGLTNRASTSLLAKDMERDDANLNERNWKEKLSETFPPMRDFLSVKHLNDTMSWLVASAARELRTDARHFETSIELSTKRDNEFRLFISYRQLWKVIVDLRAEFRDTPVFLRAKSTVPPLHTRLRFTVIDVRFRSWKEKEMQTKSDVFAEINAYALSIIGRLDTSWTWSAPYVFGHFLRWVLSHYNIFTEPCEACKNIISKSGIHFRAESGLEKGRGYPLAPATDSEDAISRIPPPPAPALSFPTLRHYSTFRAYHPAHLPEECVTIENCVPLMPTIADELEKDLS